MNTKILSIFTGICIVYSIGITGFHVWKSRVWGQSLREWQTAVQEREQREAEVQQLLDNCNARPSSEELRAQIMECQKDNDALRMVMATTENRQIDTSSTTTQTGANTVCVGVPPVQGEILSERDDFRKYTAFAAPKYQPDKNDHISLYAYVYDSGNVTFAISVYDTYVGDWRLYSKVLDSDGNSLKWKRTEEGFSDVAPDIKHEVVQFPIDRAYLAGHCKSGIRFQISNDSGKREEFTLPGGYVSLILKHLENLGK